MKDLLCLVTLILCFILPSRLVSQTVLETLHSGRVVYATFDGSGCQDVYNNVFICGEIYEVGMYDSTWYGKGYHARRKKTVVDNKGKIANGDPEPKYKEDAGSFSIFGTGFAFNTYGQFYPAAAPNTILGMVRTTFQPSLERKVCSLKNLAAGWVVTKIDNLCICCGSPAGSFGTEFTVKKIDGMEVGATQVVCSLNNIPTGWMITNINNLCICCGSRAGSFGTEFTIKKIGGLEPGATQVVCSLNGLPAGWMITNIDNLCICCGSPAGAYGTKWTIKRIEGLPKGTTQVVCSTQNIPDGWEVIEIDNQCICCGSPAETFGKEWIIQCL